MKDSEAQLLQHKQLYHRSSEEVPLKWVSLFQSGRQHELAQKVQNDKQQDFEWLLQKPKKK